MLIAILVLTFWGVVLSAAAGDATSAGVFVALGALGVWVWSTK